MIKSSRNKSAEFLFRIYIDRLLKSNFSKFILVNNLPEINSNKGLIITPNHFSWWDGFFIEFIMRHNTKRKLFIMMLEDQLKKYWFFKYLGAFSVSKNSIKESMEYANVIAGSSSDFLVFYPQGEIQPYDINNVNIKKGLKYFSLNRNSQILIVTFKIVYEKEKNPAVYCRFGDLTDVNDIKLNLDSFKNAFLKNMELLELEISQKHTKDLFKL